MLDMIKAIRRFSYRNIHSSSSEVYIAHDFDKYKF